MCGVQQRLRFVRQRYGQPACNSHVGDADQQAAKEDNHATLHKFLPYLAQRLTLYCARPPNTTTSRECLVRKKLIRPFWGPLSSCSNLRNQMKRFCRLRSQESLTVSWVLRYYDCPFVRRKDEAIRQLSSCRQIADRNLGQPSRRSRFTDGKIWMTQSRLDSLRSGCRPRFEELRQCVPVISSLAYRAALQVSEVETQ